MTPEKTSREEEKEEQQAKPRRKRKILLPVVIVVLLLVGGAIFVTATDPGQELLYSFMGEEGLPNEESGTEYKYEVPEIVVNLPGEQRGYLSLKFYMGFNEPALNEEIEERMPELRDAVLDILWGENITGNEVELEKEDLRDEILISTNEILSQGEVKEVYFWHFLVQN